MAVQITNENGLTIKTQAAIHPELKRYEQQEVEYHIIYSNSYRVPVLYFFLLNLSAGKVASVDLAYDMLVPKHLRNEILSVGVMGAIGMTVSQS